MRSKNLRASLHQYLPFMVFAAAVGVFIAFGAIEPAFAYDDSKYGRICARAIEYLSGGFGGLLSAVAGIGAIIASASGGFRMAWALVVVSIGAFILKEYVDIFFSGMCA